MYHVTGVHEFPEGDSCDHAYLAEGTVGDDKPVLIYGSDAYRALKDIVFDGTLLDEMCYCADYLHTYEIESFNALRLKYSPKRTAFDYHCMVTSGMVATLDHNFHLRRQYRMKADGSPMLHRKFNSRTKREFVTVVKEDKHYPYVPAVRALVRHFCEVPEDVPASVRESDFNPVTIAPTIRGLAATNKPTLELFKQQISRFK